MSCLHKAEWTDAVDALASYFTRFPTAYPLACLHHAAPEDWVLDPFCGGGATVMAARIRGLGVVAVDASAVAVAIAQARLAALPPEAVVARARQLLATAPADDDQPAGMFWGHCYTPDTLRALCRFRAHFRHIPDRLEDRALLGLLLGLLHGPQGTAIPFLSNHLPADFAPVPASAVAWWRRHACAPPTINILAAIEQQANKVFRTQPPTGRGQVLRGDSRHDAFSACIRFNWVITSPPYFGMDSFVEHQWLRNWLLGGPPCPVKNTLGQLRHETVEHYTRDLAAVLDNAASRCCRGAHLCIRVGTVPGAAASDPLALVRRSLEQAKAGWKLVRHSPVLPEETATPRWWPFACPAQRPVNEIDLIAVLDT